jgi:hypothetical protein
LQRARDLTRASPHTAMHGLKARMGGIDVDFSGCHVSGSWFVEQVHVSSAGSVLRSNLRRSQLPGVLCQSIRKSAW